MQNLLARLIHAREEDEKEKEKDKDVDDLEDDDLDEDDDEDFDDDDDDWDDDDEEEEGEEEAGAERRRASRRGPGRAADAARVFVRRARSARALDGPPGVDYLERGALRPRHRHARDLERRRRDRVARTEVAPHHLDVAQHVA